MPDPFPPLGGASSASGPLPGAEVQLNPFLNPGPWGRIVTGGFTWPGVVLDIDDGEGRIQEWAFQRGTSGNGAVSIWRGQKLVESIKVTVGATTATAFNSLYELRDLLLPKPGKKPPSLPIENGGLNFIGITKAAIGKMKAPKWVKEGNYWTLDIGLVEFNPSKPAPAGPADPVNPPTPTEKAIQEYTNQLAK